MPTFIDQTGRRVTLDKTPQRIISLVPSQSELLWDIGLRNELIGITKFCIHPEEMFRSVERVGGTKKLDMVKIRSLKPDLIIGNVEENERTDIEQLQREFNVWMSDIYNLDDALEMMKEVGKLTGKEVETAVIIKKVQEFLPSVKDIFDKKQVLYFIWKDPFMFAGGNTFINDVLSHIGLSNAVGDKPRYPVLSEEKLKQLKVDYCFLSSEPYPFKQKHVEEIQKLLPQTKVIIADGEVFSWYGSRLLHLPEYLKKLKSQLS